MSMYNSENFPLSLHFHEVKQMWKTALGEKQPALFETGAVSSGLVSNMWVIL